MGGYYLTWLAEAMRAEGLVVHEWPGWETRARRSGGYTDPQGPLCVMFHHTASNARPEDDVAYMADVAAARPIANVMPDRSGEVWLIAAGPTNTNGAGRTCMFSRGVVQADTMNSNAFGMELSNDGVGGMYSKDCIDAAITVSNLVNRRCGNQPEDVMTHAIYAPVRKVDPAKASAVRGITWQPHGYGRADTWVLDDLIAECAYRARWTPPDSQPLPPAGDDMATTVFKPIDCAAQFVGTTDANGVATTVWWADKQRADAHIAAGAREDAGLSLGGFSNVVLLGPLPVGDDRHVWDGTEFFRVVT